MEFCGWRLLPVIHKHAAERIIPAGRARVWSVRVGLLAPQESLKGARPLNRCRSSGQAFCPTLPLNHQRGGNQAQVVVTRHSNMLLPGRLTRQGLWGGESTGSTRD